MSIELTAQQSSAIAAEGDAIVIIDPTTNQVYRLVPEDLFQKVRGLLYDDTPWTPSEAAILAGAAFAQLDDTDYTEYLRDTP